MENNKFIKVPTNLIYMLDCDCLKLMAILIQKESYWANKGKLKDGLFIKTIKEIKKELDYANTKEVGCVIQALVNSGIIEVTAYEKKRMSAKFRIRWDKVNELNEMSLYDMQEFDFEIIRKLPRDSKITYNKNAQGTPKSTQLSTKCNSTIDNKENRKNKENKDINATTNSCTTSNRTTPNKTTKDIAIKSNFKIDSSIDKEVDQRTILNKLVCFINYDCPVGMIVQPIHTQVKCANQQLIALQNELNGIITQYKDSIAKSVICKGLWEELTSKVFDTTFIPANNVEQQKYNEIIQGVDKIGYAIAYVCKRKALKNINKYKNYAYTLLVNSVNADVYEYIRYYFMWLIAQYTLDERVSDRECCNLSIVDLLDKTAEKNEDFRNKYEALKMKSQKEGRTIDFQKLYGYYKQEFSNEKEYC